VSARKAYYRGTQRVLAPDQTLSVLEPLVPAIGVTRCADVTGLDRIGIPVYCAVRPGGHMIQVTNGKGPGRIDARVSALMEALEVFQAERMPEAPLRACLRSMSEAGRIAIHPSELPQYRHENYFSPGWLIDWIRAEDLTAGRQVWIPANAAYFFASPRMYDSGSNGLASGNEITEATLHALYELIERDAISRLCVGGRVHIDPQWCKCVDLSTITDGVVIDLVERLARADIDLKLFSVASAVDVHVFWAVFLDNSPFGHCSTVNVGYGAHLSPEIAASRAITEAAQSRLTYIHGAREDIRATIYASADSQARLLNFFRRFHATADWSSFADRSSEELSEDYRLVVAALDRAGYRKIYRVDLSPPGQLSVVKVIVPGLAFNERLF
jgi:ribosomal protein S12 methylthiotransferase accessory factor